MSIKLIDTPRVLPAKRTASLYVSDRTLNLLDFLAEETNNIKDEILFEALSLHLSRLAENNGKTYNLNKIIK